MLALLYPDPPWPDLRMRDPLGSPLRCEVERPQPLVTSLAPRPQQEESGGQRLRG